MSELIDPRLGDLALFVRVVEAGGFTAAARRTGTPQGTISRRIAALEADLGVRLLDRGPRRVTVTEAGRRVLAHARPMLDHAEAARSALAALGSEPTGALRITAPLILGQAFFGGIVARFMTSHPAVTVRLLLTERVVDLVEEGFDVAVRVGPLTDSRLAMTRLGVAERGLYAAPGYLERTAPILAPHDLAAHVALAAGLSLGSERITLSHGGRTVAVEAPARLACNDVRPRLEACLAGLGIAALPRFSAREDLRHGRLVEVLPAWRLAPVDVTALTPSRRGAPAAIRLFLRAARAALAPGLGGDD